MNSTTADIRLNNHALRTVRGEDEEGGDLEDESDEALARRLQEQEDMFATGSQNMGSYQSVLGRECAS